MEDITAALCLDNRLRLWLYPTSITNRGSRGISVFIRPSLLHLLPLPPFCPPILPLISLWYSVSANGTCLQGGHQIHYQVGQQFPHFFTQLHVEGGEEEKTDRRDGGAEVCSFWNQIMKNETQQTVVREANYSLHHILCRVKWSLQGYESCTRHISLLGHYKHLFSYNIRQKFSGWKLFK